VIGHGGHVVRIVSATMALTNDVGDAEPATATIAVTRTSGGVAASGIREEGRGMPPVERTSTVARIVADHSATRAVFRRYDIDFCCRGDATVVEACRELRVPAEHVFADLERAIAAEQEHGGARDPRQQSLLSDIVERHHAERRALPYIASLLPKIAGRYRHRDGRLDLLCDTGQDLVDTLEAYMDEEERTLLPAVVAGGCEVVRGEIDRHNGEIEVLLAHIRSLADGYVAPDWGDPSYRALMEELEALERDVKERMRIEERGLVRQDAPMVGASIRRRLPAT
jgi:regulator of cell morphogenesis and NO signaling